MFDDKAQNEIKDSLDTYYSSNTSTKVLVNGSLLNEYQKEYKYYEKEFYSCTSALIRYKNESLAKDTIISEQESKIAILTAKLDKISEVLKE